MEVTSTNPANRSVPLQRERSARWVETCVNVDLLRLIAAVSGCDRLRTAKVSSRAPRINDLRAGRGAAPPWASFPRPRLGSPAT